MSTAKISGFYLRLTSSPAILYLVTTKSSSIVFSLGSLSAIVTEKYANRVTDGANQYEWSGLRCGWCAICVTSRRILAASRNKCKRWRRNSIREKRCIQHSFNHCFFAINSLFIVGQSKLKAKKSKEANKHKLQACYKPREEVTLHLSNRP